MAPAGRWVTVPPCRGAAAAQQRVRYVICVPRAQTSSQAAVSQEVRHTGPRALIRAASVIAEHTRSSTAASSKLQRSGCQQKAPFRVSRVSAGAAGRTQGGCVVMCVRRGHGAGGHTPWGRTAAASRKRWRSRGAAVWPTTQPRGCPQSSHRRLHMVPRAQSLSNPHDCHELT